MVVGLCVVLGWTSMRRLVGIVRWDSLIALLSLQMDAGERGERLACHMAYSVCYVQYCLMTALPNRRPEDEAVACHLLITAFVYSIRRIAAVYSHLWMQFLPGFAHVS